MRRILSIDGEDRRVEVRVEAGGAVLRVGIEDGDGELVARETPGGWTITNGRRTVEAGVTGERSGDLVVQIAEHTYRFTTGRSTAGGSRRSGAAAGGAAGGRSEVRTPMPGKVVRLLREEGERVAAGDGVLVFEAMKMQNEIRAPESGVIANMRAARGTPMEGGELLFVVEPAEPA